MTINGVEQPESLEKQFAQPEAVTAVPVIEEAEQPETEKPADSSGPSHHPKPVLERPTHEASAAAYKLWFGAQGTAGIPDTPEQSVLNWEKAEEGIWHEYIDAKYYRHEQ